MFDPEKFRATTEWIITGGQGWPDFLGAHERIVKCAASRNWFIQPETPVSVIEAIEDVCNEPDSLDELMASSTRGLLESIHDRVAKEFPERVEIVNEAFALHREARYLASIPLLLASAEGIGAEATGKSLFNVQRERPQIADWIDKNPDRAHGMTFLCALMEAHPMAKPRGGLLSRHKVLHGRQLDYGNERFSLQAVSLLGFVVWAFSNDGLVGPRDQHRKAAATSATLKLD